MAPSTPAAIGEGVAELRDRRRGGTWGARVARGGRRIAAASLVAFSALPAGSAPEGEAERSRAQDAVAGAARHLARSPTLLGDLGGARPALSERGVELRLFYNETLAWKTHGGLESEATEGHSGSYDLIGLVDAEPLVGWPGLELLVHVKGQYDRSIDPDVGALGDPIDDADFDEGAYLSELWAQQALWEERVRLRAGRIEQQTLFDRNAFANSEDRQFMNAFLDNNPLVPLPSALGAALLVAPAPWVELAAGVADADNPPLHGGVDTAFDDLESLSAYLELLLRVGPLGLGLPLPGHYRVGLVVDGREKPVFGREDPVTGDPRTRRGSLAGYLSFDQQVFRESGDERQGLGLFVRAGHADPETSQVAWFWSAGLAYTGILPTREDDVLGVAAYQAIGSDRHRDRVDADFDRETGIEIYYDARVLPWLAVTPDVQLLLDPGARSASDVGVFALRFRVTF